LLLSTLSSEAVLADHPLHGHFVQRYRQARKGLARALQRAQAAGEVRPDLDVDAAAREIIATLDGLRLQWLLDPRQVDLVESLSTYAKRIAGELVQAPQNGVKRRAQVPPRPRKKSSRSLA
jgi:hypothetical protein